MSSEKVELCESDKIAHRWIIDWLEKQDPGAWTTSPNDRKGLIQGFDTKKIMEIWPQLEKTAAVTEVDLTILFYQKTDQTSSKTSSLES